MDVGTLKKPFSKMEKPFAELYARSDQIKKQIEEKKLTFEASLEDDYRELDEIENHIAVEYFNGELKTAKNTGKRIFVKKSDFERLLFPYLNDETPEFIIEGIATLHFNMHSKDSYYS